jgi:hypothetical protein
MRLLGGEPLTDTMANAQAKAVPVLGKKKNVDLQ